MTLMSRRSQSNADKMVTAVCILFALAVAVATALHVPHTAFSEQLGVLREQNSSHMCKPGLKQLTGYFNIDPNTDKNYFYWYFPSEGSPETDPVILWLTGGPGCSGELALFSENGPCTINATGIYENPYTWTAAASVIYIDQPAGTGFSYANEGGYDTDEEGVSRDLDIFVRTFLSKHPEVENNPFYIFGESYGGHYVPATAWRIYSRNAQGAQPRINLEGIGIGNGLTNPMIQYQYYPEMIYNYTETKLGTPLVSLSTYEEMVQNLPYCIDLIRRCNDGDSSACVGGMSTCGQIVMQPFQMTGRNVYDIRIPCEYPPLCYDFSPITKFLNDPAVQKAIGVNREWQGCNMDVNEGFRADFLRGYEQHIPDLLEAGIRVVIYAGDCDYICNWIGNFHWTLALEWSGQTDFQNANDNPLFVPGMREAAGTIRTARGFTFVKVLDAGHMVPRDQPYIAQYLVNEFIRGSPSEKHV